MSTVTGKSLIIIGGGIAGLSAGCYGQMNGFRTRIFEMHKKKPGGLCTGWKRQGYIVNGCIHWLMGSAPGADLHQVWMELGAVQGRKFVYPEEYGRIESGDGRTLIIYSDIDRLQRHLKELAPGDAAIIDELIGAVRQFTTFRMPSDKAPELFGLRDVIGMLIKQFPLLWAFRKWNKVSLAEYGRRFRDPLVREAFPLLFMPDFPVSFILMTLAFMHKRWAGYPLGGSLEFSRSIEQRYLSLGGEMVYKARVAKILTDGDRAVGIRLEDGSEHFADYVVSAADGHATIFEMLEGRYLDDTVRGYYEKLIPFPPLVHIALGVNRTFPEQPPSAGGLILKLRQPLVVGGIENAYLGLHIWSHDPMLAPPGKTLVTIMLTTDFAYWDRLRGHEEQYRAEKDMIAESVIALIDNRFPGFASRVEMRDVATPTTFVRYTGNWKGSFEGWQVTPATWSLGKVMRKTLPGLANFYMAGHWVEPGGGLPAVAMSGRNVIQIICAQERSPFRTSIPPVPS